MNTPPERSRCELLVLGAGAIGLYLGGRLLHSGCHVHFVARPATAEAIARNGLRLKTLEGDTVQLPPQRVPTSARVDAAPRPDLVLLCVKGTGTVAAAAELQAGLPAGTPVISFQNGVDNIERLRRAAPDLDAIAGMVPFNVVQSDGPAVRQTTSGQLAVARCATAGQWAARFDAAGLPLDQVRDMRAVQWGKLLLNLNNPLNALAGVPLVDELEDRAWRRLLAVLQDEALQAMAQAGIRPARVTPLPTRWLPGLLRLPTPLFRLLARRMLSIDPDARSSMYDDRVRGRATEIDDLCGAVVRLAEAHGGTAPCNAAMVSLLRRAETGRFYAADEVARALQSATGSAEGGASDARRMPEDSRR